MSSPAVHEPRLPGPVSDLVNGLELARKVGQTISLITVDDAGWPHLSLLSVGEVFSPTGDDIRLALHAGSGTTAALTASGRALLDVIVAATNYKVRIETRRLNPDASDPLAVFAGTVVRVDEDRVDYAELTSGITYRLPDPDAVVERWQRQIDMLRATA